MSLKKRKIISITSQYQKLLIVWSNKTLMTYLHNKIILWLCKEKFTIGNIWRSFCDIVVLFSYSIANIHSIHWFSMSYFLNPVHSQMFNNLLIIVEIIVDLCLQIVYSRWSVLKDGQHVLITTLYSDQTLG